jgi:cytochrome b561
MAARSDGYEGIAIVFHWTIASLILLNSGLALFRETFAPWAVTMITAHKAIGLTVLALSICWLAWRGRAPRPGPLAGLRAWEAALARWVHRLLLFLIVAVPLAGWIFVSLAPDSRPLDWRGGDGVPELPLGMDDPAAFFWHEAHELMGFAMIGLFLLHIAAALKHQLVDRNGIIGRMLP